MFEGFTRYKLNRPLTEEETAARLTTGEPCSETPKDCFTAACNMSRRFIRKGDKTNRDGVAVEGLDGTSFQGQPLAYLGASVLGGGAR